MEEPHPVILNRELARATMRELHGDTLSLMDEVANYGSNLIPRCIESSDKSLVPVIVLGVMLRQGVAMLDATSALAREGSVACAWINHRALVEAWISAAFILKERSLERARHYFVWNLRQQRRWCRRLLEESAESAAFRHVWEGFSISHTPQEVATAREEEVRLSQALVREDYAEINRQFEESAQPTHDTWWFRPLGLRSIRALAESVGRLVQFDIVYPLASEVAHSTAYGTGIEVGDGRISVVPVRGAMHFGELASFTLSVTFDFYRLVLAAYRSGEVSRFADKYSGEWKERYMAIPLRR